VVERDDDPEERRELLLERVLWHFTLVVQNGPLHQTGSWTLEGGKQGQELAVVENEEGCQDGTQFPSS